MNIEQTFCPVCGAFEYRIVFQDYNHRDKLDCKGTYVRCKECSLIYLRDRPPWEDIVGLYSRLDSDLTANPGNVNIEKLKNQVEKPIPIWKQFLHKVRSRPHSEPLEAVTRGSKRLLDLGCGNGSKLVEFYQRGYEVWGIDVSIDSIKICQELLPQGHFIQGELQEADLPDTYFDYVRIDNVLEHVPNPREVIKECHRLLRQDGQLIVYVPHGRSLSIRIMKGSSISSWIPFHLQLFTRDSLKRLLDKAGFKDMRIYGYNPVSWLPLSIMQFRSRTQPIVECHHSSWLTWACYPIGWLAAKLGIGEELVAMGKRS